MDEFEDEMRQAIRKALTGGDPTGWFEQVYARADTGQGTIPWARNAPDPHLIRWLHHHTLRATGKKALVVGCDTGDDAEALASVGFEVTGFDISETAIAICQRRFPESPVDYQVADLFQLPPDWTGAFDFVLESRTLQSLPWQYTEQAIAAVAAQVAPGGTLLVLCIGREPDEDRRGIPSPLSRRELAEFLNYGLVEQQFEEYSEYGGRRFCVEYRRDFV